MIVERGIAGLTLSFTAGIIAAAAFSCTNQTIFLVVSFVNLIFLAISTSILIHPFHRQFNTPALRSVLVIPMLCCGVLCWLSSQIRTPVPGSSLSDIAVGFSTLLNEKISGIPFSDRRCNAIISALITGDKSMLSYEVIQAFRKSGASHILALSGLHLGIIYSILKMLLYPFGRSFPSRIIKAVLITSACGFYTIATGASASITRAFLFIFLSEIAGLTGRDRSLRTILWSAMMLQLMFDPTSIKEIGFQLSYAALFGIAYINPCLRGFWPEGSDITYKGLRWIWNSAAMSISCQMTTGPLAWMYFGTFPKYFILTNLISLPIVSLMIPCSVFLLMLECCGVCPGFMIRATQWLILTLCKSLETISLL